MKSKQTQSRRPKPKPGAVEDDKDKSNKHVPCLSLVQYIGGRRQPTGGLPDLFAQVRSPMQVLPKANWSTVRDRWCRWSPFSGNGSGKLLSGDEVGEGTLRGEVAAHGDKTLCITKDAAQYNQCQPSGPEDPTEDIQSGSQITDPHSAAPDVVLLLALPNYAASLLVSSPKSTSRHRQQEE